MPRTVSPPWAGERPIGLPAALAAADVALWHVPLDDATLPGTGPCTPSDEAAAALLGPCERRRWRAFRCPRAATGYLRQHLALRRLLRRHFGITLAGRPLALGPQGKPALPGGGPPWFSLSRSGAHGCIALSARHEVGVDIEQHRLAVPPHLPGVFDAREQAVIRRTGTPGFYRLWTGKEAVLKALGVGFSVDPRSVCVARFDRVRGAAPVRLWAIDSVAGCSVALACVRAGEATEGEMSHPLSRRPE